MEAENDPQYATRTDHEVRTLDVVVQVARILANQMVAGPEKKRLQRTLLRYTLAYARSINAKDEQPPETLSYTLPNGHAQEVGADEIARNIELALRDVTRQLSNGTPRSGETDAPKRPRSGETDAPQTSQ